MLLLGQRQVENRDATSGFVCFFPPPDEHETRRHEGARAEREWSLEK